MRSTKAINILFILFYVYAHAHYFPVQMPEQGASSPYEMATEYYENKEYEKAIPLYTEVLEKTYKNNKEVTKKVALSYAALNKADKAAVFAESYLKIEYEPAFLSNELFAEVKNSPEFIQVTEKYDPSFDFWTIIYLYSGLIGVFVACMLNLRKKSDRIANLLISTFILLHSLFIIHISLYLTHYEYNFPHSLRATATFSYLYGPLLYFYFRRTTENYHFKRQDILHLIPFLLFLLYIAPTYFLSAEEKLSRMLNRDEVLFTELVVITITKSVSLIVYGYFIFKCYRKSSANYKHSSLKNDNLKWQKNIVIINSTYIVFYLAYALIILKIIDNAYLIHPQVISMSFLVLYVGYAAYTEPSLFQASEIKKLIIDKYKNSGLTKSLSKELKHDLIKIFDEEKIYTKSNITLDFLSEKLQTTRHNTSQVINEHFDMNFFELINKFRIQEAKLILKNDHYRNLSIVNIAYEVGYNNKVTFNKAFKKETGLTPTQYIDSFGRNKSKNIA